MLVIAIVSTVLLVALPAAQLYRDWQYRETTTRTHHVLTRVILVAWAVAGVLAGVVVWAQNSQSARLETKIDELMSQNDQLRSDVAQYADELTAERARTALLEAEVEQARRGFVSTLDFYGRQIENQPGSCGVFYREEYEAYECMRKLFNQGDWSLLLPLCEEWMEKRPDWPTPHMFAGIAHSALGHRALAVALLEHVERHAAGDTNYAAAIELLHRLRH